MRRDIVTTICKYHPWAYRANTQRCSMTTLLAIAVGIGFNVAFAAVVIARAFRVNS